MSSEIELAKEMAETIMQDASYKLGDVLNGYPPEVHVLVLVIMQRVVDTIKPMMSESDRDLFDRLIRHTNVIAAPTSLDPRKREAEG